MIDFSKLSDYAASFTQSENDLLRRMEKKAHEIYIPIMHPAAMAFLQQVIRWKNPKHILELGTAIGYSSIRMRLAAGADVDISSVERDRDMIREAKENIRSMGFESSIHVIEGDATRELPEVRQAAPFDLILFDAAKAQYEHLFPVYADLLSDDGIIITDNVLFHGLVCDIEGIKKKQLRRLVEKVDSYNHFLVRQQGFDTIFLTVGDGLAVSTKKSSK
ncbi:O-methyltransferase [Sporolactobacillus sp. Y61]|uniref:tRNA 5-hydroxyuridine methyltransferase n=1 Tax=Sporolactobacillus sp. Y61 TaxID=3160863 RepID=A0AAU8IDV2_9BACL|nr:O-methyltransferase [Sporolactobacillus sp. THM19-2]